jgi:hypothetical protein
MSAVVGGGQDVGLEVHRGIVQWTAPEEVEVEGEFLMGI